jgi:hypothetical protein
LNKREDLGYSTNMLYILKIISVFIPFILAILGGLLSLEKTIKHHFLILVIMGIVGIFGTLLQSYFVYKEGIESKTQEKKLAAIYDNVVCSVQPFIKPWGNINLPPATKDQLLPESIKNLSIRITDLVPDGSNFINGKIFENCLIIGPAIIFLDHDVIMSQCKHASPHNGGPESLWITVPDRKLVGVIGIRNVQFIRCYFLNIGLIGPEKDRIKFLETVTYIP